MTIIFLFLLFFDSGAGTFLLIFGLPIVLALIWYWYSSKRSSRKLEDAIRKPWQDYSDALDTLKANPTNADLKQKTLALGREFRKALKKQDSGRTYSEESIMNDINAACAGTSNPKSTNQESIETRLAKLHSLKEKGLIDDQEFHEKRQQILTEI